MDNHTHLVSPPITGILKGGLLWKQHGNNLGRDDEHNQVRKQEDSKNETFNPRTVRFIENNSEKLQSFNCQETQDNCLNKTECRESRNSASETTRMMMTFRLENYIPISNNSLKPNSAVRQLFPSTRMNTPSNNSSEQLFNSLEQLQTLDENKDSTLLHIIQRCEKQTSEFNTFRRPLISYEPKTKKNIKKNDNSLIERIKLLTCDFHESNEEVGRITPSEEELTGNDDTNHIKFYIKNTSPSSSSTTSSNSSSGSSTYKKLTDLFVKKEKNLEINNTNNEVNHIILVPDIGGPHALSKYQSKANTVIENKKQLLSSLVPLTACVNIGNKYEYCDGTNAYIKQTVPGTTNSEYVRTNDIRHILNIKTDEVKPITPDVLAGTPIEPSKEVSISPEQDNCEEKNKNKYLSEDFLHKEDDEHDDYGFNRRPNVQGVKPRLDNETLKNDSLTWPYYSDNCFLDSNIKTSQLVTENTKVFSSQHSPKDGNVYKNNSNRKVPKEVYNTNVDTHSTMCVVEVDYNEYYSPSRITNNRPLSPPPHDFSKNYHSVVYIPYDHLEGYQPFIPSNNYHKANNTFRLNKFMPQNKTYFQEKIQIIPSNPNVNKPTDMYLGYNQLHVTCNMNKSIGQTAVKSTQTLSTPLLGCDYFNNLKCKSLWKEYENCNTKSNSNNPNSFPLVESKFLLPKKTGDIVHEESTFHYIQRNVSKSFDSNNYLSLKVPNTKMNFLQRSAPDSASVVPENVEQNNSSNIPTSPSSSHVNSFYAMNV